MICGTPTPAITRVVQIDPGPIPILMASAPALIRALVASAVPTLPAISSQLLYFLLMLRTMSTTPFEWPCAVSTTTTSTAAAISASTRSIVSAVTPTAAPTRNLPCESLQASGWAFFFWISLKVISPLRMPPLSTTGSFSILCCWRRLSALSSVVPTGAVTRFSSVITSEIFCFFFGWNRRSLLVRMPTSFPAAEMIGMPEIWYLRIVSSASPTVWSGRIVTGSMIMPLSERLTLSTCSACAAIAMFLWMTPIPPSRAMAIAIAASVTVSIAEDISGMLSLMLRVSIVVRSASRGSTDEALGTSRTSSKVRASVSCSSIIRV